MELGKIRFSRLCHEELARKKERDGIGLLAEKRMHGILKRFFCDDFACHEVKVMGRGEKKRRFVADVLTPEGQIFEIQTGSLYPMRAKLAFYMEETDYKVTVVHPLLADKQICVLQKDTGEVLAARKSPVHETPLVGLAELKLFASYLLDPRFSYCMPLLSVTEYRFSEPPKGRRRRASARYELLPDALLDTVWLHSAADVSALFPDTPQLAGEFTAATFGKHTRLRGYALYDVLSVFETLGIIAQCGKQGRAKLYRRVGFDG